MDNNQKILELEHRIEKLENKLKINETKKIENIFPIVEKDVPDSYNTELILNAEEGGKGDDEDANRS